MNWAVVIYFVAGIGFAWALPAKNWQRLAMIIVWLPMIAYGMLNQFVEWWQAKGYQYDGDE